MSKSPPFYCVNECPLPKATSAGLCPALQALRWFLHAEGATPGLSDEEQRMIESDGHKKMGDAALHSLVVREAVIKGTLGSVPVERHTAEQVDQEVRTRLDVIRSSSQL